MAKRRHHDEEFDPRDEAPRDDYYAEEYTPDERGERPEREERERYTRKEKIQLEKELVKEGKLIPRYTPRNPIGRIVALILVFFLGMFATIGGVIGVVVYYGSRPTKEALGLFNIPYEEYITPETADKSILDIVDMVTHFENFNSLNAIADVTPLVDKLLDGVDEQLSALGVHIDKTTLKTTEFSALGAYFSENVVQTIVLGEVLHLKPTDNPMLIALCYGEEGIDYDVTETENGQAFAMKEGHSPATVGSITNSGMDELLQKMTIETVLGVNAQSDAAFRYLAYGEEGVNYRIEGEEGAKTIVMLQDDEGNPYKKRNISTFVDKGTDILFDAKISALFDADALGDGILKTMADKGYTLKEMTESDTIADLKIGEIINTEDSNGILGAVKDWTVSELGDGEKIKTLKIGDIMDTADSDGFLGAVSSWTINDLSDTNRIRRLKISQITGEAEGDGIFKTISSWRIGDLDGGKFDTLTLGDVLDLGEGAPVILTSLSAVPLGELSSAVNELSLSEILGDVSDNKILKSVQNSTLETLATDLQALTVRDIFGDEIYAYRAIGENGKTYADIVKAYGYEKGYLEDETGIRNETNGLLVPLDLGGAAVEKYYTVNGKPVTYGVYKTVDGTLTLVAGNPRVFGKEGNLLIEEELRLTPVYAWKVLDYSSDTYKNLLKDLPAGESVLQSYGDKTLGSPENVTDTPFLQDGSPLYYVTAEKYYPLYEDDFACYYLIADESGVRRVDLDYSIVAYTYGSANLTVTDGKVTYADQEYIVRAKAATESEAGYDYIIVRTPVTERYYLNDDPTTLYLKSEVTENYRLDDGTKLERFLDGVWYMLFGGETYDASGNITVFDNTDTAITEIAPLVTKMSGVLNETPMWELYLHGMITSNPYVKNSLTGDRNVNELTIAGCIYFLRTGHFPTNA